MLVFLEGEIRSIGTKKRTNNKFKPHMALMREFELGPYWWEASALTTAPPLLPLHSKLQNGSGLVDVCLANMHCTTSIHYSIIDQP